MSGLDPAIHPNPTCAKSGVRSRQINGLDEKSSLHFVLGRRFRRWGEGRRLVFGRVHAFGQDDAEAVEGAA